MSRRIIPAVAASALLTLAVVACGGGSATSAPSVAEPAAPSDAAAEVCTETTDAGAVAISIKDFTFNPAEIQATVGQVIQFTNEDSAGHTATVIDGSCTTPVIAGGAADGLVFSQAGSYPFRCDIHKQMTGTITVS